MEFYGWRLAWQILKLFAVPRQMVFFERKCLFYDHINIKKIQLKKTNLNNLKLDHLTLVIIVFLLKMRTILYL